MQSITNHSIIHLKKASNHLFYEMWMLEQLVDILDGRKIFIPVKLDSYTHTPSVTDISKSEENGPFTSDEECVDSSIVGLNNAIVEAFTIHTRALIDFFYGKAQKDDVIAEHFFSPASIWIDARPQITDNEIKKIKTRVSKEVAHLTYIRQDNKGKKWSYINILKDLKGAYTTFYNLVPKNLLGIYWNTLRKD